MNNYNFDGKKIMIVESDYSSSKVAQYALRDTGAMLPLARNGVEAIQMAQNEPLDLILMGIRLPIIDGYKATQTIRELGITVPIIAYTSLMPSVNQECIDAGCNDVLNKPVYPQAMRDMIAKYLK